MCSCHNIYFLIFLFTIVSLLGCVSVYNDFKGKKNESKKALSRRNLAHKSSRF